jgi:hypothetical protein
VLSDDRAQVQARIPSARVEERVGQQVDALLLRQAAGVEDVDLAGGQAGGAEPGVKAADVDAPIPAPDPLVLDSELRRRASDAMLGDRTTSQLP